MKKRRQKTSIKFKIVRLKRRLTERVKYMFKLWYYTKYLKWFRAHADNAVFKFFENASWFKLYGKRVVYVKSKIPSKLSATEADVKNAIQERDFKRALEIVNGLPESPKTVMLKQIIESNIE